MSKITMESLKQSFKGELKTLYSEYVKRTLVDGTVDTELIQRVTTGLDAYVAEVHDCIEDLDGDPDVVLEWMRESLNEIRLGDLIFNAIEDQKES